MAQDSQDPPAPRISREELLRALAAATSGQGVEGEDGFHSRIVIKPDGEVLIENLSFDLMELALLLDPEAEMACEVPDGEPTPEAEPSDDPASQDAR